jgi:hypothetical protein
MSIEQTSHPVPALWLNEARGTDGRLHSIIIYGVPSVFPRVAYCQPSGEEEGPNPLHVWMWGMASWYEATVDGEWADSAGHMAYESYEDALDAAIERIREREL